MPWVFVRHGASLSIKPSAFGFRRAIANLQPFRRAGMIGSEELTVAIRDCFCDISAKAYKFDM